MVQNGYRHKLNTPTWTRNANIQLDRSLFVQRMHVTVHQNQNWFVGDVFSRQQALFVNFDFVTKDNEKRSVTLDEDFLSEVTVVVSS